MNAKEYKKILTDDYSNLEAIGFLNLSTPGLKILIAEVGNITYIGRAEQGTKTNEAGWLIQKIDTTSGVEITWAENSLFDKVWDDRESLTYN